MPVIYRLPRQQGLFSRLLSAIVLLAIFAAAFFLGMVLFLVILGTVAVLALVFYLRLWWLRRTSAGRPQASPQSGVTLEGEYSVSKPTRHRGDEKH